DVAARSGALLRGRLPGVRRSRRAGGRRSHRHDGMGGGRRSPRPCLRAGAAVPLLARMIPSPLNVHVRRGAIAQLADLLADQRISTHGRVAVAVGPTLGDEIVETIRPTLADATVYRVRDGTIDDAQELAGVLRG